MFPGRVKASSRGLTNAQNRAPTCGERVQNEGKTAQSGFLPKVLTVRTLHGNAGFFCVWLPEITKPSILEGVSTCDLFTVGNTN